MTGVYQGRRRMTVTYPLLDRARQILWLVTGPDKVEMLPRLLDGDRAIPAGRVARDRAVGAGRSGRGGPPAAAGIDRATHQVSHRLHNIRQRVPLPSRRSIPLKR